MTTQAATEGFKQIAIDTLAGAVFVQTEVYTDPDTGRQTVYVAFQPEDGDQPNRYTVDDAKLKRFLKAHPEVQEVVDEANAALAQLPAGAGRPAQKSQLELLADRLVRGEISPDEFVKVRDLLQEGKTAPAA
jgi:hypothetical protein